MRIEFRSAFVACLLGAIACHSSADANSDAKALTEREHQLDARLAQVDRTGSNDPVGMWIMPEELREISGIALTADGRVLAHDDEIGKVYEIDPKRGVILKRFQLGKGLRGDFEGITVAGADIYMMLSNGVLYQFREGADGSRVPYTIHDTKLGHECEFEGVAYERDSAWLLMPCKNVKTKSLRDQLVIYRWRIGITDSARLSMLSIPMTEAIGPNAWKTFKPTDITIDPFSGNYVMVAGPEKALVEMTPGGEVLRSEPLPGRHRQAEGVAITRDSLLMISDEATTSPAAITLYRWRTSGNGAPSK
jgi:uncharacterized protein YjiK